MAMHNDDDEMAGGSIFPWLCLVVGIGIGIGAGIGIDICIGIDCLPGHGRLGMLQACMLPVILYLVIIFNIYVAICEYDMYTGTGMSIQVHVYTVYSRVSIAFGTWL